MTEKWFISDTHWGHKNVLRFCPSRAELGATIEEHDEELIRRWNKTVAPKDIVYHLGDVAFGERKGNLTWVKGLNGTKKLLRGNHDTGSYQRWAEVFEELLPSVLPLPGMTDIVLSHAPIHQASMAGRWQLNVHGHMHESVVLDPRPPRWDGKPDIRYMNISVEQIGFQPIHYEAILMRLRQVVAPDCRAAVETQISRQRKNRRA